MTKIGILGGGQLGKMFIQNALNFPIEIWVYDPDPSCPCSTLAHHFVSGSFDDELKIKGFAANLDILTWEIESIDFNILQRLNSPQLSIFPYPSSLKISQDKAEQKKFLAQNSIPTSNFSVHSFSELVHLNFDKAVLKLTKGGYDGRGVWLIDKEHTPTLPPYTPVLLEDLVDIDKEISVLVGRNRVGETVVYDPVEMVFDPKTNQLDYLFAPAEIPDNAGTQCQNLALLIANHLDLVGIMAVEFFLTKQGEVLVNEFALRPHNSGHHTIEATNSSQYDTLLRALLDLPFASCQTVKKAGIVNLIGGPNEGPASVSGLNQALSLPDVYIHWYGKPTSKPNRKMGHVTVLGESKAEIENKINHLKNTLLINGRN